MMPVFNSIDTAIIFVVDAADHDRFVEAKNEICQLMKHLDGIPVLIYANKQVCDSNSHINTHLYTHTHTHIIVNWPGA